MTPLLTLLLADLITAACVAIVLSTIIAGTYYLTTRKQLKKGISVKGGPRKETRLFYQLRCNYCKRVFQLHTQDSIDKSYLSTLRVKCPNCKLVKPFNEIFSGKYDQYR